MAPATGDEFLRRVVANDESLGAGVAANALLREFFSGYPLNNLRNLLASSDEKVLKAGIWIASELGQRASPLLNEIDRLQDHELPYVRYYAIDSILTCATGNDGRIVARTLFHFEDPEKSVRRKAIDFVARASVEQLKSSVPFVYSSGREIAYATGLNWLIEHGSPDSGSIGSMLGRESAILRRFGLAAAIRFFDIDKSVLRSARTSHDAEIREFAERELSLRDVPPIRSS